MFTFNIMWSIPTWSVSLIHRELTRICILMFCCCIQSLKCQFSVFHWFCWRVGKEKQCMIIPFQHTNDTVYLVHVTFICISVWYHFTLTSSYRWKPHKSLPDQYKQRSPRHKDLLLNLTWKVPQVCSPELCTEASLFNTSISFQWGDQMHPQ